MTTLAIVVTILLIVAFLIVWSVLGFVAWILFKGISGAYGSGGKQDTLFESFLYGPIIFFYHFFF